ncbi:hypothetical protein INS49_015873 [Diaporthe citri]|uniref:uncharacterized protein n=1 Tax=Diaporthe citri TaxID=83186 RepID=UPI001C80836E|nr:uncharacterized protein INS49_015873 [Diaporthe citri]KAG6356485.1 hypothetical protein INS49_015873 [Diaporthe citri]
MPSKRKGRKSRKAAKQQKVHQAHKHREARQARRDRRSRRDTEAASVALADVGFHRFPHLPLELREMVWDECIPSRLVFHGLEPSGGIDTGILHTTSDGRL